MKYKPGTFSITPNKELMRGKPTELQSIHFWLCDRADENGLCFPARQKIAEDAGIKSVRTVDKYIKELIDMGILVKTKRRKDGDFTNKSNLYQIMVHQMPYDTEQEMHDQGANGDTEQGATVVPITIPTVNNTQLTIISEPVQKTEIIRTGTLPESRGKTYVLRVLSIYKDLFRSVMGYEPTVNIGLWGKLLKELLGSKSEVQCAALLVVFFHWHGMNDGDSGEYQKILNSAFNVSWFFKSVNVYEAYLRNVQGLDFDSETAVRAYVGSIMSELKKQ